jgi:hypothetical protein
MQRRAFCKGVAMIHHPILAAGLLLLTFGCVLAIRFAVRRIGEKRNGHAATAQEQKLQDWMDRNL